MARCARVAALLLVHVNLLLFLFAGASLATAARLKWDPSTYIVLRELLPFEYRVLAGSLCAGGVALLLLGHLCAAALATTGRSVRRVLLFLYAASMALMVASELALLGWLGVRTAEFLHSDRARQIAEIKPFLDDLKRFLDNLGWLGLFDFNEVKRLIEEVQVDAVCNVYVVGASGVLLGVLQPLAIVLALMAASFERPHSRNRRSLSCGTTTTTSSLEKLVSRRDDTPEKLPLRTAYKNGRIVIL